MQSKKSRQSWLIVKQWQARSTSKASAISTNLGSPYNEQEVMREVDSRFGTCSSHAWQRICGVNATSYDELLLLTKVPLNLTSRSVKHCCGYSLSGSSRATEVQCIKLHQPTKWPQPLNKVPPRSSHTTPLSLAPTPTTTTFSSSAGHTSPAKPAWPRSTPAPGVPSHPPAFPTPFSLTPSHSFHPSKPKASAPYHGARGGSYEPSRSAVDAPR